METMVILAAIAAFFWGILGLIKPRWFGLPSRWAAACLTGFSFVLVGMSAEFYPKPGASPGEGMTLGMFFAWGTFSLSVIGVRAAICAQKLIRSGSAATERTGFVEKIAVRWAEAGLRQRRGASTQSTKMSVVSGGHGFRRISHNQQPRDTGADHDPSPAEERNSDNLKSSRQQRWDRNRVGKSSPVKKFGTPIRGPISVPTNLMYVNHYGEVSYHKLHSWYEYEGHVSGWCTESQQQKNLSKRYIEEWFDRP